MTYQALARKWRPRSFEEVVGQPVTLQILSHALEQNRLHHAYLFTGTRGVGKTTLARIFAKCLNCETGITATPCQTCDICKAIDAGNFLDLYEIDAASRTKVEDTRELLENVHYPPSMGRFKIYLIDEVHMLSNHSFNALLKTLEEPPAHVKFLLATTDPKRLPITVLSRCLQFHLRHIQADVIQTRLSTILQAENIPFDAKALALLAQAATGSMRDALSLSDQAIAFGLGTVSETSVKAMLGSIAMDDVIPILKAILQNDNTRALQEMHALLATTADPKMLLEELANVLHQVAIAQVVPDLKPDASQAISALANELAPDTVQLYYQIALLSKRDLELAPTPHQGAEMALLRMMAFSPTQPVIRTEPANGARKSEAPEATLKPAELKAPAAIPTPVETMPRESAAPYTPPTAALPDWQTVASSLGLSGIANMLVQHAECRELGQERIQLVLREAHYALLNDKLKERLQSALSTYFKRPLVLQISQSQTPLTETPAIQHGEMVNKQTQAAKEQLNKHPLLKNFLERYDATLDISML